MTISSQTRKAGPYNGNGLTTTFPFAFKVFQASDVLVVLTNAAGVETVLTLGANYTVSLNANQDSNAGGNVEMTTAPDDGYTLTIGSQVPLLQQTDFTNQGGFYPKVLNASLDKLTIITQQLQEEVDRSAKLPISNTADADTLTAAILQVANDQANIDAVAGDLANVVTVADNLNGDDTIGTVAGSIANIDTVGENIADVVTVAENIADINAVVGDVIPNLAAVLDAPNQASAAASSAVAAANSAAAAATALDNFDDRYLGSKTEDPTLDNDGDPLVTGALYFNSVTGKMRLYEGSGWIDASSASVATLATFEFVATAGQTTFSGNDANGVSLTYTVGAVLVSLNGAWLRPGDDFTATDGAAIVLTSAAAADDELLIAAFGNFVVADTYPRAQLYTQAQADAVFVSKLGDTMTGPLVVTGTGQLRGASDADSLTLIGGAANTNNRIQIRGTNHPGTPNVMTLDLNGGEMLRYTSTTKTEFGYPAFNCRAWVNFNGTGTVAIRGSGNVSSITDNGTGNYTVNFTTAMPDANYSAVASSSIDQEIRVDNYATGAVRVVTDTAVTDAATVSVAIFR